jgi:hypothetical protein
MFSDQARDLVWSWTTRRCPFDCTAFVASHLEGPSRLTASSARCNLFRSTNVGPHQYLLTRGRNARGQAENPLFGLVVPARKANQIAFRRLAGVKHGPAQRRADARQKLVQAEWSRYEIIGATVERLDSVLDSVAHRDHHDRNVPATAYGSASLPTFLHTQIEKNQIHPSLAQHFQRFVTVLYIDQM